MGVHFKATLMMKTINRKHTIHQSKTYGRKTKTKTHTHNLNKPTLDHPIVSPTTVYRITNRNLKTMDTHTKLFNYSIV